MGQGKYWTIEGWSDNRQGITAVQYILAPHESAALQRFEEIEGAEKWQHAEATEITQREFYELLR